VDSDAIVRRSLFKSLLFLPYPSLESPIVQGVLTNAKTVTFLYFWLFP